MRFRVLLALLGVLAPLHADDARQAEAMELLRKAIEAQGELPKDGLKDLEVTFEGQIKDPQEGDHSITRTYWYRVADRSFRIRTAANVDKDATRSERGVLGHEKRRKQEYWEWSRGERMVLKRGNREHEKNIEAIDRDRADFERILRMVVLARAEDQLTSIRKGKPEKTRCTNDTPNSRSIVFPGDTAQEDFLVLDVAREGSDPLRLFLSEKDLRVRKVVQFDRAKPGTVRFVYYLGGYPKADGLAIPRYVSVHTEVPSEETREATTRLSGRLTVRINPGLADETFAAEAKKSADTADGG